MANFTDNIISLASGKKLGLAEFGDPKGKPVFYFHGWPSSRLQPSAIADVAKKLHVRIVSLDRPGYGLSDFVDKRKLLDWPKDVLEVADKLNIKKFAVMGVSGGGPYAAACAYKIPDRITKVGIIVGLAPTNIKGVLQGLAFFNKLAWGGYHYFPYLMQISSSILFLQAKKLLPESFSNQYRSKSDQVLLKSQKLKEAIIQTRTEAFRQGKRGAAMDLKIYTDNWGFNVKDIKSKVFLWYGTSDKQVTLQMAKFYNKNIKNSKLTIYPGEGHMIQITHAKEILQELTTN